MADSPDLIDFTTIEPHKENIQSLLSGRSARALASLFSPLNPTSPSPSSSSNPHATTIASFESELALSSTADDPLDIHTRYVTWALSSYPSPTAPSSPLLPLLERATAAFLSSPHYANDPRYLKLWLLHISLFADAPGEAYKFLERRGVGRELALFWEEWAGWVEGNGEGWERAEEVWRRGGEVEGGTRPVGRLRRRWGEFRRRREGRVGGGVGEEERGEVGERIVRPALGARREGEEQAAPQAQQGTSTAAGGRPGRAKLAVFEDAREQGGIPGFHGGAGAGAGVKGWESMGSVKERKKENAVEARPWAGEKLDGGKTNGGVQKMMVFKDQSRSCAHEQERQRRPVQALDAWEKRPSSSQPVLNLVTGKYECVVVDLEEVYPDPDDAAVEFCFEQLWARGRGLGGRDWGREREERKRGQLRDVLHERQMDAMVCEEQRLLEDGPELEQGLASVVQKSLVLDDVEDQGREYDSSRDRVTEEKAEEQYESRKNERDVVVVEDEGLQEQDGHPDQQSASELKHGLVLEKMNDGHAKHSSAPNEKIRKRRDIVVFHDDMASTGDHAPDQRSTSKFRQLIVLNDVNNENDENNPPAEKFSDRIKRLRREDKANRTRKIKVMEVKGAPQTIQTNLDSPTRPKLKRKKSAEPTMTVYTKAATDEIYEIFNQPLKSICEEDAESGDDDSEDDCTSAGESTGLGRISGTASECGEETRDDLTASRSTAANTTETRSVSEFSDITERKEITESADGTGEQTIRDSDEHGWEIYEDHEEEPRSNEQNEMVMPASPESPGQEASLSFIALPSDGFEKPRNPYRDPVQVAQSRLPYMTPIVERTESSFGGATAAAKKYSNIQTPCQNNQKTSTVHEAEDGPWSSPFQEIINEARLERKLPAALTKNERVGAENAKLKSKVLGHKKSSSKEYAISRAPVIQDAQCNPVDEHIRTAILEALHPPLAAYAGYYDRRDEQCNKSSEIRKYCKALSKTSKNTADKTPTTLPVPPSLCFESRKEYIIRRELGKGAFAPVYLAESRFPDDADEQDNADAEPLMRDMRRLAISKQPRSRFEAIKMEQPPSPWEFYILSTIHKRLGSADRAAHSIIRAHEFHLFADECYLIEDYAGHGSTMLDLVNIAKADSLASSGGGAAGQGIDELLVAFYAIELLRTVEALHAKGIVHGDLKADNVLARFGAPNSVSSSVDDAASTPLSPQYDPAGARGWAAKGITLIDFGRGIDMRKFRADVGFVADWETTATDCPEMRECRPWSWQADYWGLAGCVHVLLFGKYFDGGSVVAVADTLGDAKGMAVGKREAEGDAALGLGAERRLGAKGRTYRLATPMKRYWNQALWAEVFEMLLNAPRYADREDGGRMPCLEGLRGVRERVEEWLQEVCERGVGLRGVLRRLEEKVWERERERERGRKV